MRRWARTVALVLLVASARLPHLGQDDQLCASLFGGSSQHNSVLGAGSGRRRSRALRHLPLDPAAPIAPDGRRHQHHQRGARNAGVARRARPTSTRSTNTFPHALLHCSNRSVIPQQFGRFPVPESVSVSGGRPARFGAERGLRCRGCFLFPGSIWAQAAQPAQPAQSPAELREELQKLRAEFDSIRDSYGAWLAALEARLAERPAEPAPAAGVAPVPAVPPPVPETPAAPVAPAAAGPPRQCRPRTRPPRRCEAGGPQGLPVYGNASAMSKIFPDIAVIGNFTGAAGRNEIEPRPALQLDEAELSLQAVVDPYARADFFLAASPEGLEVEVPDLLERGRPADEGRQAEGTVRQGQHAPCSPDVVGGPGARREEPSWRR